MSDIRLVKLRSGEELIGDVTVIGKDVIISNPCQVIPSETGINFMPWPAFTKNDNVTIALDWTVCIVEPIDEARDAWNTKYGSGIILPNFMSGVV